MANHVILFENAFDLAASVVDQNIGGEVAGFPQSNMFDWRAGTAYRWVGDSAATGHAHRVDLGAGNDLQFDCFAIAGHNFGTAAVSILIQTGDDGLAWNTVVGTTLITTDLPVMFRFTSGFGARRWWRVRLLDEPFNEAPQCGVFVLGRELVFEEGPQPALDAYGLGANVENVASDFGHHLGVNVRNLQKTFTIAHEEPGMTRDGFYNPAGSGINFDDDFKPHAVVNALPFFFAWNHDIDPPEVYLSHVDGYNFTNNFVGSISRRALNMEIKGRRETA